MRRPYVWVGRLSGRWIPAPYQVRGRLFAGMTDLSWSLSPGRVTEVCYSISVQGSSAGYM